MIGGGATDIKRTNTTFFGIWFSSSLMAGGDTASTTESTRQEAVLFGGTVSKFRVRLSASAGGSGTSYTFNVRKNGTNTGVTCTITATANTCSDTTNTASFVTGDLFSIAAVPSSSQPANDLEVSWYARY